MWSKLRKKVVKPERKDGDAENHDGKVILQKFDRIPSYVGDISEPVDWHVPGLDNGVKSVGGQNMRPLSTFGVSYSPKLPGRKSLSSFDCDDTKPCYGVENCSVDGCDLEDNLFVNGDDHSPSPPPRKESMRQNGITENGVHANNLANGNIVRKNSVSSPKAASSSSKGSYKSNQNTITVNMDISLSMGTPTLPKKDKKYERVVTNDQVIKEQRNSPARRKKSDLPPVTIPDKTKPVANGRTLLSSSASDQRLSSGPSTATSDNVFELEVQFERQESGYATLDDQASSHDNKSVSDPFTPSPEPAAPNPESSTKAPFYKGEEVKSGGSNLVPNGRPHSSSSTSSAEQHRIYPTFRKQTNPGNNNSEPAVLGSSAPAAKPANFDINQNLENQKNSDQSTSHTTAAEVHRAESPDFPPPPEDLMVDSLTHEKVEYCPADSSVSKIYHRGGERRGSGDLGSSVEDLYASVPKGTQRLSTDEGTATASGESSRSSRIEDEESVAESESTVKTNETSATVVEDQPGEDDDDDDVLDADDGIDLDLDIDNDVESEDNEPAPPIPEKNYKLLNEGTLMRETVGKRAPAKGSLSSENDSITDDLNEPTHMSWDEVMTEARSLGIPWSKPPTSESIKSDNDRLPDGYDHCDCNSVCSSEISNTTSSSQASSAVHSRRSQLSNESKDSKHEKKRSPFKDKFKFQSLFSKKSKAERHSSDSSLHKYNTVGMNGGSSSSNKKRVTTPTHCPPLGSPVSNPGCVCSPRSSRSSLLRVPSSPGHHHSSITLPRDISGSTTSWGSTNGFQRSLSVSQSSTSLSSVLSQSSSSSYGGHNLTTTGGHNGRNMMSVSMMAAIPSSGQSSSSKYTLKDRKA